jgi:hypothetical protein
MRLKRDRYSLHRLLTTLNDWCLENLFQGVLQRSFHRSLFLRIFSIAVEAEEGRTKASISFRSSSSLRKDILVKNKGIKASND